MGMKAEGGDGDVPRRAVWLKQNLGVRGGCWDIVFWGGGFGGGVSLGSLPVAETQKKDASSDEVGEFFRGTLRLWEYLGLRRSAVRIRGW